MTLALLARPLRPLRSFAVGGAWFFIVVSLIHLVAAIAVKWQEPSGVFKLYHTVVDGRSYDAPWLCYDGTVGLVIALLQATVVAAAAVATRLPWRRTLALRRAGHVALLGWSALWAADLLWLASIDGQLGTIAQAALLGVLFACTGARAAMGWKKGSLPSSAAEKGRLPLAPPPPPAPPAPDDRSFRTALRQALAWTRGAASTARTCAATGLKSAARLLDRGAAT